MTKTKKPRHRKHRKHEHPKRPDVKAPDPIASKPPDPVATAVEKTTTLNGMVISDLVGGWLERVYLALQACRYVASPVAERVHIVIQTTYASQTSTSAGSSGGRIAGYRATIYLDARPDRTFVRNPDDVVAHEFGHAWGRFHQLETQQNNWRSYLVARELLGNPLLDTNYNWAKDEILADDYRLLFGSPEAIASRSHMNHDIPQPREVPGLQEFLAGAWQQPA